MAWEIYQVSSSTKLGNADLTGPRPCVGDSLQLSGVCYCVRNVKIKTTKTVGSPDTYKLDGNAIVMVDACGGTIDGAGCQLAIPCKTNPVP